MSQSDSHSGGGEKKIIINPNLFAHTLKNSRKRRPKEDEEEDTEMGGLEKEKRQPIRMKTPGISKLHRSTRKSILRKYRDKQEELNREMSGGLSSFSEENGVTKLKITTTDLVGGKPSSYSEKSETEFTESMNFFKDLKDTVNKGENIHGGKLMATHHQTMKKQPQYGCMKKGGQLPTYRQWLTNQNPSSAPPALMTRRVTMTPSVDVPSVAVPSPLPLQMGGASAMLAAAPSSNANFSIPPPILGSESAKSFSNAPANVPIPNPETSYLNFYGVNSNSNGYSNSANVSDSSSFYGETGGASSFVPPLMSEEEKRIKALAKERHDLLKAKETMVIKEPEIKEGRIKKQKKTVRRKLRTGLTKKNIYGHEEVGKVSILIPNQTIRKKVDTLGQTLRQTPMQEVKKYLLKRGFIKVGSPAPNDVLRKIYEELNVLGDVYNRNGENIVYNFKVGGDKDFF